MKLASIRLLNIPTEGKYFLLLFLFLIILSTTSISQNIEPRFEHLSVKDGLPEGTVKAILQDYLGYMWFGTQNRIGKI